jgi:phosphoglycolate phosphatase-like HAD superfamily hydrolase
MKKVVLFDKGDLLTNNKKKWERFDKALMQFHPAVNMSRTLEGWDAVIKESHRGKLDHEEEMAAFLDFMGLEAGAAAEFMALVKKEGLMKNPLFPGVRGTLAALRGRGWRLCIVSDTARTGEQIMHDVEGIEHLIDCAYSSAEFGKIKGEGLLPEVLAIEKPDDVWFVCHDQDELEAGLAAGIKTIKLKDGSEIEKILGLIP